MNNYIFCKLNLLFSLLTDNKFRYPRKGKNNDKAHPPIHPTSCGKDLNGYDRSVFEFITRRFLACCSDDAKGNQTTVLADIFGEHFSSTGTVVLERNYLDVYKYDSWNSSQIPEYLTGEVLYPKSFLLKEGRTTPPGLLSEADLINCMDLNGIGTDATIHEHINKIITRKYVIKQNIGNAGGVFIPTRLGTALVEAFDQLGLDFSLTQPKIRSQVKTKT